MSGGHPTWIKCDSSIHLLATPMSDLASAIVKPRVRMSLLTSVIQVLDSMVRDVSMLGFGRLCLCLGSAVTLW